MDLTFQVPYAILLFTALDFASITIHIYNWIVFLLWLRLFILSELWMEVRDTVQEKGIKTVPKKKKCKKAKWLSEEALQIAVKRREAKSKGEKERYIHLNAEFQRIARRDKKAFLSDQYKEIEKNNRIGNTSDPFKKFRDTKGTFHVEMCSIKDINGMDLTEAEDIKKRWQKYTEAGQSWTKWLELQLLFCNTKVKVKSLSHVHFFATPWTVAYQAPPYMGFSRQEYWTGCHVLRQGIFPRKAVYPHQFSSVPSLSCV